MAVSSTYGFHLLSNSNTQPFGADDLRVVVPVAESPKRDERVEHRRENGRQSIRTFEPLEHPLLGLFERAFAERMDAVLSKPLGKFVDAVEPEEEVAPGDALR